MFFAQKTIIVFDKNLTCSVHSQLTTHVSRVNFTLNYKPKANELQVDIFDHIDFQAFQNMHTVCSRMLMTFPIYPSMIIYIVPGGVNKNEMMGGGSYSLKTRRKSLKK